MGMLNLKSKYNDFLAPKPFDFKSEQHNMHFNNKRQSKVVSQPARPMSPPVSLKAYARSSVTPTSSVESTPKTSIDEERLTVSRINFASETLPEYQDCYAVLIDGAFSRSECSELIAEAESSSPNGWERSSANPDQRNCGRIIQDSRDLADKIWDRISHLPELKEILCLKNNAVVTGNGPVRKGETWNFDRVNDHMRFLKYEEDEYFRPHCDGSYETPDRKQRSYFTMQLYLNDAGPPSAQQLRSLSKEERRSANKSCLMGGNTSFHSYDGQRKFDVAPKAGSILIFQHRDLLHSGTDVLQGTKYTLRTDLMYSKA